MADIVDKYHFEQINEKLNSIDKHAEKIADILEEFKLYATMLIFSVTIYLLFDSSVSLFIRLLCLVSAISISIRKLFHHLASK